MRRLLAILVALVVPAWADPVVVSIAPQAVFTPSNVLTMKIGGRTPGPGVPVNNGYDQLNFTSALTPQVTWGGTLVIDLINSFAPVAGDAFDLFNFDSARDTGAFPTVTVLDHGLLAPGLALDFSELYTTGIVRTAAAPVISSVTGAPVSRTKITVDCTINPSGGNTTAWLEYGLTSALGSQSPPIMLGNSTTAALVHFDLTGLVKNTPYFVRVRASNAAGAPFSAPTLAITTFRGRFQEWAYTDLGDVNAQPLSDHDGDGVKNIEEYALALFPAVSGVVPPFPERRTYAEGQRIALLFSRHIDRDDLTIEVQSNSALAGPWTTIATSINSAPFTGPGFVNENRAHPIADPCLVEVRDTQNLSSAPQRFLRIQLTLAQ